MTHAFTSSVTIDRPVAEVWQLASAVERWPEWMNGLDSARLADGGTLAARKKVVFHTRGADRESEVLSCEPPHELVLASRQAGFYAIYRYRFAESAATTSVQLEAECEASGLLSKLMAPMVRRLIAKTDRGQPQALKALIESGTAGD